MLRAGLDLPSFFITIMSTPATVFLSYAHEDAEPALKIADALRASGLEV